VKYRVKSEPGGTVLGLGVFAEGEEREFNQDEADSFVRTRGVKLTDAAMPEGFTVSIVVGEE
jgi:hypothetical protein